MENRKYQSEVDELESKDTESRDFRPGKHYKPFLLRFPTLCTLLLCTLVLIGAIELVCRRLPNGNSHGIVGKVETKVESRGQRLAEVKEMQVNLLCWYLVRANVILRFSIHLENVYHRQESIPSDSSTPTNSPTVKPPPSDFLNTGTRTSIISPPVSDLLNTGTRTTVVGEEATPTSPLLGPPEASTSAGGFLNTGTRTATLSTGGFLNTGTRTMFSTSNHLNTGTRTTTLGPTYTTASTSNFLNTGTRTETDPAAVGTPAPGTSKAGKEVEIVFTQWDYFVGAYIPTIIAVLFTIPWVLLDSATKEMEPFFQLGQSTGVSAANTLCLNYPGINIFISPFVAVSRGHAVVFFTSLLQLLSLGLAPLAAEAIFVGVSGCRENANCYGLVSVYPTAARVVQGVLSAMAVLVIGLIIGTWRRTSGLLANPNSLAAIATLFHSPLLINLFRTLTSRGKETQIKDDLSALDHTYQLSYYQHPDGSTPYGVTLLAESNMRSEAGHIAASHDAENAWAPEKHRTNKWDIFLTSLFAAGLAGLLMLITYYSFTGGNTPFERFMNSQGFGVKFLFVVMGIVIKKFWERTRNFLRSSEPFHNLTIDNAKAKDSLLLDPRSNPFSTIITSLSRREFSIPLIDLATILSEPLIIALGNIPFSNGTTLVGFIACSYTCICILSFMLLALVVTLWRLKQMKTEKVPETLAGKMMLLAGSHMLDRFRDLSALESKDRDRYVRSWGYRYAIGDVVADDGVVRRTVDFEGFVRDRTP